MIFGKQRFYYQASSRVVSRGCRKRTPVSTNELFTLGFLYHVVKQLAIGLWEQILCIVSEAVESMRLTKTKL